MSELSGVVPTSQPDDEKENEWETKRHMDTLMDAHAIIHDPVKLARVHALAGRHSAALKSIKSVKDLKSLYDEKFGGSAASSPAQKNSLAKPAVSEVSGDGDDGN